MNYFKRVCLFKEYSSGYTYSGNKTEGIIKCEQINSALTISLSIVGLAPAKNGSYYLVIGDKNLYEIFELDNNVFKTSCDLVDISQPFCAGIVLSQENKLICYASTPDYKGKPEEIVTFFTQRFYDNIEQEAQTEKEIEDALSQQEISPYVDDIVATENYFEKEDVDLENLSVKEVDDACKTNQNENANQQDLQQEKNKDFATSSYQNEFDFNDKPCFTAIEDVENVLRCYKRYEELEHAIYGSVWVTIPLDNGEYYFGKAQIGEDKYLCYAVKGEKNCCPEELKELSCFVPSAPYRPNEGYYVMFQNAENGKVIKK